MGICASCLGLNRHPSQHTDENNPLLSDRQEQYGGTDDADTSQPDEEEVRREREELDHITTEATDNMVDVSHPGTSELSQHFAHARSSQLNETAEDGKTAAEDEDEEAAWLQSVQDGGSDDVTAVKGLQSGNLVLDMSQLRDESTASPSTASKKTVKARPPQ